MQNSPSDIRKLSELMDSKFGGPGGFRFGWDGIIGLVPFLGDLITNGTSLYIIVRAASLGCPPSVLMRMGLNVLIDNLLDVIPLLGNVFDFFWRSNNKNIAILDSYLNNPGRTVRSSRVVVWLTVLLLLTMMILFIVAAYYVAMWVLSMLPDLFQNGQWET